MAQGKKALLLLLLSGIPACRQSPHTVASKFDARLDAAGYHSGDAASDQRPDDQGSMSQNPAPDARLPPSPWVQVAVDHPLGVWVQQSPKADAPIPRFFYEGGGAWDPYSKRYYHHGGHDGIPQAHFLFSFDLLTRRWEQLFTADSPPDACLVDGTVLADLASRRIMRWPALSLHHGFQFSREIKLKRSWIWLYDPSTNEWVNMRPPPYPTTADTGTPIGAPGGNHAVTFDARRGLALSNGGAGTDSAKITVYDAYRNEIEQVITKGQVPSNPRDDHGFAYDAVHDAYLVWGGQYNHDSKLYRYLLSSGAWEAHDLPNPPPSAQVNPGEYGPMPRLACDGMTSTCLLVGREGHTGAMFSALLDTEALKWTILESPKALLLKSRALNLSYAPDLNLYVLALQSSDTTGDHNQVWTFRVEARPHAKGPAAPPSLTVRTTSNTAQLEWLPSPEATRYRIFRGEGTNARNVQVSALADVSQNSFTDEGLASGTNYFYEVRSINKGGEESLYGPRGRTALRAPEAPVLRVLSKQEIRLTLPAKGASDSVGFNVYRGTAQVATTSGGESQQKDYNYNNDAAYPNPRVVSVQDIKNLEKINVALVNNVEFKDTEVSLGTPTTASGSYPYAVYAYVIKEVNALGVESGPSPYVLSIPSPPRKLMVDDSKAKTAILHWEAPKEGAQGYRIYLVAGSGLVTDLTPTTGQTSTSFTHTQPIFNTRYSVTAIDAIGQEGEPSPTAWFEHRYDGFFTPPLHQ